MEHHAGITEGEEAHAASSTPLMNQLLSKIPHMVKHENPSALATSTYILFMF